jgi:hypothetical protein
LAESKSMEDVMNEGCIPVYTQPERRRAASTSFSFPLVAELDMAMGKELDLVPALERLGKALAEKFDPSEGRAASALMGTKSDKKRVIGVRFHRVEFSLIYDPSRPVGE